MTICSRFEKQIAQYVDEEHARRLSLLTQLIMIVVALSISSYSCAGMDTAKKGKCITNAGNAPTVYSTCTSHIYPNANCGDSVCASGNRAEVCYDANYEWKENPTADDKKNPSYTCGTYEKLNWMENAAGSGAAQSCKGGSAYCYSTSYR